jgi:hypothetical protein
MNKYKDSNNYIIHGTNCLVHKDEISTTFIGKNGQQECMFEIGKNYSKSNKYISYGKTIKIQDKFYGARITDINTNMYDIRHSNIRSKF